LILPPLPHLTCLYLGEVLDPSQELLQLFVTAYGEQLTSLECEGPLFRFEGIGQLLPNLKRLCWRNVFAEDPISAQDLGVLSQVEWKLEELEIPFNPLAVTEGFVAALNKFCGTLKSLHVQVEDEVFDLTTLNIFPHLRQVKIFVTSGLQSLPLATLSKLSTACPRLRELDLTLQCGSFSNVTVEEMGTGVFSSVYENLQQLRLRKW